MGVKLFRSTDTGAPSLTGQAGSLVALIDAVLTAGYNSKTVTITRSGTTATASCTAHGFPSDGLTKVRIAGANESPYNGDQTIFNVTANTFDFTVAGSPATPATGTITAKVAPADVWVKEFAGTNLGVYRTSDVTGGGRPYIQFLDTTTTYCQIRTAEVMYDASNGANFATGRYIQKSSTADGTARPWVIVADDRFVQVHVAFHASHSNIFAPGGFGDITSEVANDLYGGMVWAGSVTATPTTPGESNSVWTNNIRELLAASTTYLSVSVILARAGDGVAKSPSGYLVTPFSLRPDASTASYPPGGGNNGNNGLTTPSPVNGAYYMDRIQVYQAMQMNNPVNAGLRGYLPGIYGPRHARPTANLSTYVSTSPATSGRKFLALDVGQSATASAGMWGQIHVDLTGPWR